LYVFIKLNKRSFGFEQSPITSLRFFCRTFISSHIIIKGIGKKFFRRGDQRKKDRKLAKKYQKIALFSSSREGGNGKNTEKIVKKGRKIAKNAKK